MKARIKKSQVKIYQPRDIRVSEWSEQKLLPPSQVHLILTIDNAKVIVRLKSPEVTNELIAALEKHRDAVWLSDGTLHGPVDQVVGEDDLPEEGEG